MSKIRYSMLPNECKHLIKSLYKHCIDEFNRLKDSEDIEDIYNKGIAKGGEFMLRSLFDENAIKKDD